MFQRNVIAQVRLCSRRLVVVALLATMGACSKSGYERTDATHDTSVAIDSSRADTDWRYIVDGLPALERGEGESVGVYVMRNWIADLGHIREAGLKFWERHSDDPRRYDWLAITTHFPPPLALSVDDWIDQELSIGANTSALNEQAIEAWSESFQSMRAEYNLFHAGDEKARRFLLFGELRGLSQSAGEDRARGRASIGKEDYAQRVIDFFSRFPHPIDEEDRGPHSWEQAQLIFALFANLPAFEFSDTERDQLLDTLIVNGSEVASEYKRFCDGGDCPDPGYFSFGYAPIEQFYESQRLGSFEDLDVLLPDSLIGEAIFFSVQGFPADNQPYRGNALDLGLFSYDTLLGEVRYTELGMRYWPRMDVKDRFNWLMRTSAITATLDIPEYIFNGSTNWFAVNGNALALEDEYDGSLASMTQELIRQDGITRVQIAALNLHSLWRDIGRIQQRWPKGQINKSEVDLFVAKLGEFVADYDDVPEVDRALSDLLLNLGGIPGLSESEQLEYYSSLVDIPFPEARAFVRGRINPVKLGPGVEVRLQTPTLKGDLFDTASLQGKIVLIDHWDTNCAPCIAAFPGIHETYLAYQARGFEVVSIAYDGTSQRHSVERIKERMGLTWTTLDGEGLWGGVAARYGYPGYPQYMLLDREGRWVAGTAEMGNGTNLEALLDEMLAAEAAEKEASTAH